MGQPDTRRRLPDGYADRTRELADALEEGAQDLRKTRHSRNVEAVMNASIDAETLMNRAASLLRKLR